MKILLAAPIHETAEVFLLYLKHLRALKLPLGVELDKAFVLHNCESLKIHLQDNERCFIYNNTNEYKKDEITHFWKAENFGDVVCMKNYLIQLMLEENYDYIFYVDSDLMLHPNTLIDLYEAEKDMISEIFWTKWTPEGQEMPNAWYYDHYSFIEEELKFLKNIKGYHKVGMTGACTLIKRKIFEAGINWSPISNLSITQWEDRAFCVKVAVAGFEIWTSNKYPAKHLYRDSITKQFIKEGGLYE